MPSPSAPPSIGTPNSSSPRALAGKDIYVQKPLSMTLAEGRAVSDTVTRQEARLPDRQPAALGSPWPSSGVACELVRNGRIGKLHTVKIGLPDGPVRGQHNAGDARAAQPELRNVARLHARGALHRRPRASAEQTSLDRPGWLRIDSYCLGMITGWGSHHVDIAHWGMGTELTGPIEIEGQRRVPEERGSGTSMAPTISRRNTPTASR